LRIDGIRSALQHSEWFEEKPPVYGEASDIQALELMAGLAENPNIDGMISTEGWPMDNAGPFREFSKIYGSKKTIIVGGQSSTQKALFEEGVVDELIGPLIKEDIRFQKVLEIFQLLATPFFLL
jgi:hypothetical protein